MSNILVVGLTKEAALKQADYLTEKYKEYGIESMSTIDPRYRKFNNGECMIVLSYIDFINSSDGLKYNSVYFDKELPQNEFFQLMTPRLIAPCSLWQF